MRSEWSQSRTEAKSPSLTTSPGHRRTSPHGSGASCWFCPSSVRPQPRDYRQCCFVPSSVTFQLSTSSRPFEVRSALYTLTPLPDRLWGPVSVPSHTYWRLLPRAAKMVTHIRVVQKLKMRGAIPPLSRKSSL